MSKSKSKKSKAKEVSTKIYARVRGLMPWEPKKVSLAVEGIYKVRNKAGKIVNEYDFARVFKPNSTNAECFKVIVMPLISNVLQGFNAVLIAYGQTGSGKTFSMLGKPKLNIVGLLPMMLAYMVDQPTVTHVELSAVEAFGHHVAKIALYDLFSELNQTPQWKDKTGNTGLDMMKATSVPIKDADDAHSKIIYAHAGSHFAPTGKNPESSRGHVTFVAKVSQQISKHESKVSYFVMVDCAGSEGETAFTPEFKARIDAETLMARRLEAGTINTGLSQLQVIFNQLRTKGKLTKAVGNGLRRVLHPYINTKTFLAVLFTLSPAINNAKSTESTLKFAVTAGMVKVKPIAMRGKMNFGLMVKELKAHIQKQEGLISQNDEDIEAVERKIARTREAIDRAKRGLPVKQKRKKVKKTVKKKVLRMVKNEKTGKEEEVEVEEEVEIEVYEDMTGYVDSMQKDGINNEMAGQMMDVLDESMMELFAELDDDFKEALTKEKEKVHRQRTMTVEDLEEQMKNAMNTFSKNQNVKRKPPPPEPKESRIERIKKQLETQEADYSRLKDKKVEPEKLKELPKEELSGYGMELDCLLNEQKAIVSGLQQSKAIIVDYLRDDGREALLQYFKMRGLLD